MLFRSPTKKLVFEVVILSQSSNCQNAASRGEEGGFPCPFLKIGKKGPDFRKECPECVAIWIKFLA